MDEATIKSMAAELAKGLKTPEDLNQMTAVFKKFMIETALNTELSDHLGYEKHQSRKGSNSRNGFSSKTITTQDGQLALDIPRDREGSFEPQIIKSTKHASPVWMTKSSHCMQKGMTNRKL
nr:transposase [Acinetobacter baumannii]